VTKAEQTVVGDFRDVASVADLVVGVPRSYEVEGRSIVLVKWQGEVVAIRNVCPHQSRAFEGGRVRRRIRCGDRLGEVTVENVSGLIVCPWHAWSFDLRDGRCAVDSKLRVKVYATQIHEGRVFVAVRS
jgi:nitrite reductase (NADH) small subunit